MHFARKKNSLKTPHLIIIAGPNGAGKSTTAPALLQGTLGVTEFVNADVIAQGLSAFNPERAAFYAGRVMLERLQQLAGGALKLCFRDNPCKPNFCSLDRSVETNRLRLSSVVPLAPFA